MSTMKYTIFFLTVITMFACGTTYTCPNEQLKPVLRGYRVQEADTLIIKRYVRGTNFSNFKDSSIVTYPVVVINPADTSYLFFSAEIDGRYDVKVINPFDNKSVLLTDFTYQTEEGKRSGGCYNREGCYSPLISYKQNGVIQNAGSSMQAKQVVLTK
jgi:hypothetical protein